MKRSEYDRPRHPLPRLNPQIHDTWKCCRCGVIHSLQSGWKLIGTGKTRRRICKPCHHEREAS